MVAYLSPQWLERADELLRSSGLHLDDGAELVIQQTVAHGSTTTEFHLTLDSQSARIQGGRHAHPDVEFTLDIATARAVAQGTQSAQVAFQTGALAISGDIQQLVEHRAAVAGSDDVLAALRADTTFETDDA